MPAPTKELLLRVHPTRRLLFTRAFSLGWGLSENHNDIFSVEKDKIHVWENRDFWTRATLSNGKYKYHTKHASMEDALHNDKGIKFGLTWEREF